MSFLFGDPEARRRKKRQEDLDTDYYKRRKIYNQSKEDEREKMARQRGVEDAHKIGNQKPFYQKVIGAASAIGKDVMAGSSKVNTNALFTWGDSPAKPRAKRRKVTTKKKRKRRN